MLKIRIIPSLLYNGSNLVKGKQFNSWRTVGSVFQNIKLFLTNVSIVELIRYTRIQAWYFNYCCLKIRLFNCFRKRLL